MELNNKYKSAEIIKRFYLNVIKNRLYNLVLYALEIFIIMN